MATLYMLKPARNALFLDGPGIGQLPYVLLLVALFGGLAATALTRVLSILRLERLVLLTFLVFIGCLGLFRFILPLGWTLSYYAFFVWVNLCSLMAPSLLWLLANGIFDAREARRLFVVINTTGILGVIGGSLLTGWIVDVVGTENLLLICIGFLAVCLVLLMMLRPTQVESRSRRAESKDGALSLIAGSDLLRLMGGMATLAAIVAAIVDVQFNEIVDRTFETRDEKTAFFGQFFASLNLLAFLFQLFVAPRILRSFGVTPALLFLPLCIAVGSVAVLLVPGLAAGIMVKVGDGGFRHSIHKSAVEILYLPISAGIKKRTKVLLDTTVDNVATGLGALLVLLFLALGTDYQHLSWLSIGLIVVWLGLVFHSRDAYVGAFRRALERREIDAGEFTVDISEASTVDNLLASLTSPNERRVIYALEMLSGTRAERLIEPVQELLRHDSNEVRRRALIVLKNQDQTVDLERVEALLRDDDLEVRIEALCCLCLHSESNRFARLQVTLKSPDRKLRTAAVGCIATYGTEEEHELVDAEMVRELYSQTNVEGMSDADRLMENVQAAKLIGNLDRPALRLYLEELPSV